MRKKLMLLATAVVVSLVNIKPADACTNILVTRGASKDGSTMVTYAADSHTLFGYLSFMPAGVYPEGAMRKVYEWDTGKYLGQIKEARKTYQVIGNMNENQVVIAESTYGGREELVDTTGLIDYGSLMYIALQRARTAREAVEIMGALVAEYGYYSSGESISIADPNEVWYLEIIGKGTKMVKGVNVNKGAVWVALRIPDGYISAHANHARITNFPMNDPQNCLYSPDVISFARKAGYFKGKDSEFSFSDAYAPLDFGAMRGCEARVWAIFRNAKSTVDMAQYEDYALGKNPKNRIPLWVKPAEKLSARQVWNFMRDHYEGTVMDMRNDVGAGGSNCPYRWRPMSFKVDDVEYTNERAVATQQTGFWFLGQCRSWLPNAIGGILWFGVDDAGTSTLTPIYCSSTRVPDCLSVENGSMTEYSDRSQFWLNNRITNFAYLRYDRISADIHKEIDRFESRCESEIPAMDAAAKILYEKDPKLAIDFLTNYTVNTAQNLFETWVKLDKYLFVKYKDGNVMKEVNGQFKDNGYNAGTPDYPEFPGYNERWKRSVAADPQAETLKVIK